MSCSLIYSWDYAILWILCGNFYHQCSCILALGQRVYKWYRCTAFVYRSSEMVALWPYTIVQLPSGQADAWCLCIFRNWLIVATNGPLYKQKLTTARTREREKVGGVGPVEGVARPWPLYDLWLSISARLSAVLRHTQTQRYRAGKHGVEGGEEKKKGGKEKRGGEEREKRKGARQKT